MLVEVPVEREPVLVDELVQPGDRRSLVGVRSDVQHLRGRPLLEGLEPELTGGRVLLLRRDLVGELLEHIGGHAGGLAGSSCASPSRTYRLHRMRSGHATTRVLRVQRP